MSIFFLTIFATLGLSMASNFSTILIQDHKYYVLSQKDLGTIQGNLTTYIHLIILPL